MLDFAAMAPLACLMHWYISMLYVVPVLAVGGWGWWSSKRMARRRAAELNAAAGEHRPSVPA
jgi:hypothetical protein